MLGENVGRVSLASYMVEAGNVGCDGFANLVVGQGVVALGELGVGNRSGVDYCLVVADRKSVV